MGVADLMGLMLYHAAQRHLALSADTPGRADSIGAS
jgi:hypothetical protein